MRLDLHFLHIVGFSYPVKLSIFNFALFYNFRGWTIRWRGSFRISSQILLVIIAKRSHPFPFRIRKLSPPAPMVLEGQLSGRVGRCQHQFFRRKIDGPKQWWPIHPIQVSRSTYKVERLLCFINIIPSDAKAESRNLLLGVWCGHRLRVLFSVAWTTTVVGA